MAAPNKRASTRKKTIARSKKKTIAKKGARKTVKKTEKKSLTRHLVIRAKKAAAKKPAPKSRMRLYVMEFRGDYLPLNERLIPGSSERAALLASKLTGFEVRGWQKGRSGEWRHVLTVYPEPTGPAYSRSYWWGTEQSVRDDE